MTRSRTTIWRPALALAVGLAMIAWPRGSRARGDGPATTMAAPAARMAVAPTAPPAPPPVPVGQLGGTPAYGGNSAVTFSYSSHYYHPGATVTASVRITSAECRVLACYLGANWTDLGAPPGRCRPAAMRCSWPLPATVPLYQWQDGRARITTTLGMQESDDFYAVIPRAQSVLETHVTDVAGNPYSNLAIHLTDPISATLTTDGNGFAVALVPAGRYGVRLDAGTPAATRWFRSSRQSLPVRGIARAHIVGYNHLQVSAGGSVALANGLQAITLTVHGSNPFGQPVSMMGVRTAVAGPGAVLCALPPGQPGYLEPQDVTNGTPLYLPVNQNADGNGNLSYQVFFGAEPGTWHVSFRDSVLGAQDPWLRRMTVGASVRLRPVHWATASPTRLRVTLYNAKGRGSVATLSPSREIWQALHGATVRGAVKGNNGLTLAAPNAGDPLGSQKAALRWVESFVPLPGLEIGPVFSGGSTNWGVAIFLHHRFGAKTVTRILDVSTLGAIMDAGKPVGLPALPTLAQWAARTRSAVLAGYDDPTPEAGFTYYGLPYLPRDDGLFASFEANCGQRAP